MVAQQYQMTDAGMQALLSALEEQINSMKGAHNTVESIRGDISSHYTSESASRFLSKVDEWQSQYAVMTGQVGMVTDSLGQTRSVLNNAHEQASSTAGGWTAGADSVFSHLAG